MYWGAWVSTQSLIQTFVSPNDFAAGVTVQCVWTAQDVMGEHTVQLRALMVTMPLLLTNVVATVLVGGKVWYVGLGERFAYLLTVSVRYYRREIKSALGSWRKTSRVEKVLVLLLESGCIYCLIWVCISLSEPYAPTKSFRSFGSR